MTRVRFITTWGPLTDTVSRRLHIPRPTDLASRPLSTLAVKLHMIRRACYHVPDHFRLVLATHEAISCSHLPPMLKLASHYLSTSLACYINSRIIVIKLGAAPLIFFGCRKNKKSSKLVPQTILNSEVTARVEEEQLAVMVNSTVRNINDESRFVLHFHERETLRDSVRAGCERTMDCSISSDIPHLEQWNTLQRTCDVAGLRRTAAG